MNMPFILNPTRLSEVHAEAQIACDLRNRSLNTLSDWQMVLNSAAGAQKQCLGLESIHQAGSLSIALRNSG
jgi:hypothetical protein